ncbi:two-component response regulator [Salinisphaera dokdonensis CL-ES53]|uniref:Two-component response regulator n=1 Tax=Salinisphaera dokdonensis CL-ES53 TaxID=1304272 RepID=A0ABV2B2J9_9GAMM
MIPISEGIGVDNIDARDDALQSIQYMIAQEAPLEHTLAAICEMIEADLPEAMTSIMLFDWETHTLKFRAGGSSLPAIFREAAAQVPVGPEQAICGTAAHRRDVVICEDISRDPNCEGYRAICSELGIHAGWSYPLLTKDGSLLGTFAIYQRKTGAPTEAQRAPIERAAGLVALAIERHRDRRALRESEQRYSSLFTHNPDAVFSLDKDGFLRSVNQAACDVTGVPEVELIGLHYHDFVVPDDRALTDRSFQDAIAGVPQRYQIQIVDAHGALRALDITNLPSMVDGAVAGVYGIAKDITRRREQETQLRILQRSVETTVNGVVIADATRPDRAMTYVNEPFLRMTGYTRDEVMGLNCDFLHGPETDPKAIAFISERAAACREGRVTLLQYRKDGSTFWDDLFVSPVPDENGEITHFVSIHHDVTVQKAHEEDLAHQASHEPLTGLPNRGLLEKRLQTAFAEARRHDRLLAVLYIDLDEFKPVNDTLGHGVGDTLLNTVARRLSGMLAPGDTLAGVGGDEFVMLLPNLEDSAQVLAMAERALNVLDRPHRIGVHEVHVTGSIGIAVNEPSVDTASVLIRHADMAMYLAKRKSRNTYHWYTDDITETMNERVAMRRELHDALAAEQFTLHYQPIVDAHSGEVDGFEALIRWHHPERGLVPPVTFIPLAEQTGQITPIGEWVMRRACHDIVALNRAHGTSHSIAVNISPVQFHGRNFLGSLLEVLEETNLSPHLLKIELTEGVLMENTDAAIDILRTLRHMGVDVFIDDFGTGFSSLSYLKNLPINKVKIDRTFTREITTNAHDAAIAQGIITMAHHLGLEVVAEGIETIEQHEFLRARGCDLFQGYLFARPMPLSQVSGFLDGQAIAASRSAGRPQA